MRFVYKVKTKEGTITTGEADSADKFSLARSLRAEGGLPISITEKKATQALSLDKIPFLGKLFQSVKLREKILFTRNLSGMLSAGLSLYRALEVMKKQSNNPAMDAVLAGLMKQVNAGGKISDAMKEFPAVFSPLFISMVRAGEESGNLSSTLKEIGTSLEKAYDLSRKIKGAMMYPLIIVIAIFIIGILMLIFVVPTLTKIFKDLGTQLPATTQFVVSLSDFAAGHPILFLGGAGLFLGGIYMAVTSKKLKPFNDKIILNLPSIGLIVKEINTARTARTLSSLLLSGVEMTKALSITEEVVQNMYYKKVLQEAGTAVQKGVPLSTVFKDNPKLYPVMVGEMISVGEETGALTNMLADIATFYEEEVDAKTKSLSTIIEPILMMFIGASVGFFAVSMISPMYSLLNSI